MNNPMVIKKAFQVLSKSFVSLFTILLKKWGISQSQAAKLYCKYRYDIGWTRGYQIPLTPWNRYASNMAIAHMTSSNTNMMILETCSIASLCRRRFSGSSSFMEWKGKLAQENVTYVLSLLVAKNWLLCRRLTWFDINFSIYYTSSNAI